MSNQMSVGSNLQEMENVVTKGAAPEPMPRTKAEVLPQVVLLLR